MSAEVQALLAVPPVRAVTLTLAPLPPVSGPRSAADLSLLVPSLAQGASGAGTVKDDAAAPMGRLVEPGIRFNLVGFVCARSRSALPRMQYRVLSCKGAWSPWRLVTFSRARGRDGVLRTVAEPEWTGSACGIQVRGAGTPAVRATFVNVLGDATTGDRVAGLLRRAVLAVAGVAAGGEARAATEDPTIVTRKQWGADESWRSGPPRYGEVKFAVVHHTVGGNTYTAEQAASVVRAVYYYHAKVCKFSDIGYNFLIDRYGVVYEGRYGGIHRAVMGAQALGFNSQSTGVSVMGDFREVAPPTAAVAALEKFLAWKLDEYHIDPASHVSAYCSDTDKFKGGTTVRVPAIALHREVCNTDCPGDAFSGIIGTVRKVVADTGLPKIYGYNVTPAVFSPNGDGSGDQTLIEFIASEPVDWVVAVTTAEGMAVRTLTGSGQTVSVAWDGCDDLGAPLPDGTYLVTANAAGLSGVAREGRASVVLDTAVPTLTVQPVAPAVVNPSGGVVGTKANTSYAITEPCAVKAVVRDQAGVAVHAIQGWTSRGAGEYTLTWDGRAATDGQRRAVADGTYTVEVTARDGAGNRVAQAVPLTIDRSLRLDAASQQYLSPNGDGRADSAVLTFTTVRAAKVQMAVGRVGREVLTTPLGKLASGEHQAAWDGRDALGAIVPDGKYLMLLSLANGAGGSRAGAYAVVDTKQPRIRVGKPSKVRLGRTAVTTCLATDAGSRFVDVKVVVRNAKGKVVRRAQMKAVTTGKPWRFRFLPPRRGRYTATFTLVDLAGNRQLKPAIWKVQVR